MDDIKAKFSGQDDGLTALMEKISGLMQQEVDIAARLDAAYTSMAGSASAWTTALDGNAAALTANNAALSAATDITTAATGAMGALEAELANVARTEAVLAATFTASDASIQANTAALDANTAALLASKEAVDSNVAAHTRLSTTLGPVSAGLSGVNLAALGVGAAFAYSNIEAAKYQTTFNELENNTVMTTEELGKVRQAVLALASETGQSVDKLASGLRSIKDFGFSVSDAITILSEANKNAVSTGADLLDVSTLLGATMHVYGYNASQASMVLDIMYSNARSGNVTMAQWAATMERVNATAAALGVSLPDISAAFSALTQNGIPATRAATGLVDIMVKMTAPTAASRAELERVSKLTGVDLVRDFSVAGLSGKGLSGVLADLTTAFQKMGLDQASAAGEAEKLINAQRGGLSLMDLLTVGYTDYNAKLVANADILSGKLTPNQEAYNRTLTTSQVEFDKFVERVKAGAVAIGDVSLPHINDAISALFPAWGLLQKATDDSLSQVNAKTQTTLEAFAAMDEGIRAHDQSMADGTNTASVSMITDMGAYQDFLNSALPAAEQTMQKHKQAYDDLKTSLENDLQAVMTKIGQYQSNAATSNQQVANNYAWLVAQLQAKAGQIIASIQLLIDAENRLQEAAGGHALGGQPIGPLSPSEGGYGSPQANAATTADAQAGGSAKIAAASGKTKDLAQAHYDAAKATVAHDEATLAFNQGLDKLSGTQAKSAQTLATENQLYKDQQTLLQANTALIDANTQATIDSNNERDRRKGESDAKKADAAADSSRIGSQYIEDIRAKQAVRDAQKELNDVTDEWDAKIKTATDALKDYAAGAKASLAAFKGEIDEEKDSLDRATDAANRRLAEMQDKIDADTDALKRLKDQQEVTLQGLRDNAAAAEQSMKNLRDATAAADEEFARSAHQLSDALYDLQNKEDAAAAPFDEKLLADAKAMDDLNAQLEAVNQKYAVLTSLQEQLQALNAQQDQLDHAKKLHEESVGLDNLTARLATATGAEREQLQAQYDAAKAQNDLDSKKFSLGDRIAALEQQKKLETDAINARIHAQELQTKADEKARAAAIASYEEQKKILEAEQRMIDHQREDFDYMQHQKEIAAQAEIDAANAILKAQSDAFALYDTVKQGIIDGEAAKQKAYKKTVDDYVADTNRKIKSDQEAYDAVVAGVAKTTGILQTQIDTAKDAAKVAEDNAKDKVTFWQGVVTQLSESYTVINKLDNATDKGAKLTKDQADALKQSHAEVDAIVAILPQMGNLYDNLAPTFKTTNDTISTKVSDLWDPHKVGGIPYIYSTSQNALDLMMFRKLAWTKDNVWGGAYDELDKLLTTKVEAMAKTQLTGAEVIGLNVDQGIANGITKNQALIQNALVSAINAALDGAKIGTGGGNPPTGKNFGPPVGYVSPFSTFDTGGGDTGLMRGSGSVSNTVVIQNLVVPLTTMTKMPTSQTEWNEQAPKIRAAIQREFNLLGVSNPWGSPQ